MKTVAALLLMCDARDLSLAFTEHLVKRWRSLGAGSVSIR